MCQHCVLVLFVVNKSASIGVCIITRAASNSRPLIRLWDVYCRGPHPQCDNLLLGAAARSLEMYVCRRSTVMTWRRRRTRKPSACSARLTSRLSSRLCVGPRRRTGERGRRRRRCHRRRRSLNRHRCWRSRRRRTTAWTRRRPAPTSRRRRRRRLATSRTMDTAGRWRDGRRRWRSSSLTVIILVVGMEGFIFSKKSAK